MKDKLINAVIDHKNDISYICLNDKNEYSGWVADFGFDLPNGKRMMLDLKEEEHLFLLFVLASAWSRPGRWENAAFFVAYLAYQNYTKIELWKDPLWIKEIARNASDDIDQFVNGCNGLQSRIKVSFRSDYYNSILVLAHNWTSILLSLKESEAKQDYSIFIEHLSGIDGLGYGLKRMRIKIPLILRELRCQNIYKNISGTQCCVRDQRVIDAAIELGMKLPRGADMKSVLKASEIIYENFGDLYDIPLFAFKDVLVYMEV